MPQDSISLSNVSTQTMSLRQKLCAFDYYTRFLITLPSHGTRVWDAEIGNMSPKKTILRIDQHQMLAQTRTANAIDRLLAVVNC